MAVNESKITDIAVYTQAEKIIKQLYGENARFREGQYEAIEAVMTKKRVLVVQRTGWGKSLVYFVCTKLMRQENRGTTLVVSPLLVLMDNQIQAAEKMGLRCDVLNSSVKDRRSDIIESLKAGELDILFITPETLFSEDVQKNIKDIKIGLFVVDEAHCISDWGHDFRLEYGKLKAVVSALPANVPVLATTATANDRVINDLEQQLGGNVYISRGSLTRSSLSIQVLELPSRIERYAWILENINKLSGSGIIYCLTQRDCDYLAAFLKENGVSAEAYYSKKSADGEQTNKEIEERFRKNEIKVIVATIKLGMGYDKGDIAFVIHYQMPQNIVSYYQQIGRAGRNIDRAYVFLMFGKEDEDILNYFINTAFPTEKEAEDIMRFIKSRDGVKYGQILSALNIRKQRVEKALDFLVNDGFVMKDRSTYYASPKPFVYKKDHYDSVTKMRIAEMEQMKSLASTKSCYSKFIVNCLDDHSASDCGCCSNCLNHEILPSRPSLQYVHIAEKYINGLVIEIEPRKMWVYSDCTESGKIPVPNQTGICISKYGDPGYGELVKRDKYSKDKRFCNELVGKGAELLRPIIKQNGIKFLTCVPSLRSDIVRDYSERLADSLGLTFIEVLEKRSAKQQKEMQNSEHQCGNAFRSFYLMENAVVPEKIILVDDIVDSRWTLTVCGHRLCEQGCKEVYPFALADSSQKEI